MSEAEQEEVTADTRHVDRKKKHRVKERKEVGDGGENIAVIVRNGMGSGGKKGGACSSRTL